MNYRHIIPTIINSKQIKTILVFNMVISVQGSLWCQLNQSRYCFSKFGINPQNKLLFFPIASQWRESRVCSVFVCCNNVFCMRIFIRPWTIIALSLLSSLFNLWLYYVNAEHCSCIIWVILFFIIALFILIS